MTKYEIRFGLVRVSNEEFRTVEYLPITPELLRSLWPLNWIRKQQWFVEPPSPSASEVQASGKRLLLRRVFHL